MCDEIRKEVYPSELLDAFPDADSSRTGVERWFANKTGLGESAVGSMAVFYLLLAEADPTKQDSITSSVKPSKPRQVQPSSAKLKIASSAKIEKEASNGIGAVATVEPEVKPSSTKVNVNGFGPTLHIDIQIHIAPDASAEQIDQIFASMNKHLYKGSNVNE